MIYREEKKIAKSTDGNEWYKYEDKDGYTTFNLDKINFLIIKI